MRFPYQTLCKKTLKKCNNTAVIAHLVEMQSGKI